MGERAAETEFDESILVQGPELMPDPDPLPEHCRYRDEGCDLADSCLDCPFPECIYDRPGGKQRMKREERMAEITRLYAQESRSIPELAAQFGISIRTVQRDLKASITTRRSNNHDR